MKQIFFLLTICISLLTSCKKEVSNAGISLLNKENDSFGNVDTFALKVGSIYVDTVSSSNPSYLLLGSYVDPVFGKYDASFYSQVRISALQPDFGDISKITIDSVILGMRFNDYYGKLNEQNFEVYEVLEDLKATNSYNTKSKLTVNSENLVVKGAGKLTPKPYGYKFAQDKNDTVYDNIRIPINTSLAKRFITDSKSNPASFVTMDAFLAYFKGLYIKVNNTLQKEGEGGVFSFAYPPILTIYYKLDGVVKRFYFELNASGTRFNHVDCNYIGTEVEKLVKGEITDQKDFYAQANHVRGTISLPTLVNIPSNSVIHYAKLLLPVDYKLTDIYGLSSELFVSIPNSEYDPTLRYIGSAVRDSMNSGYSIDIRDHVQQVITGKRLNNYLVVSPKFFSLSAERIHFLGPKTQGDEKPRLLIKYSTF